MFWSTIFEKYLERFMNGCKNERIQVIFQGNVIYQVIIIHCYTFIIAVHYQWGHLSVNVYMYIGLPWLVIPLTGTTHLETPCKVSQNSAYGKEKRVKLFLSLYCALLALTLFLTSINVWFGNSHSHTLVQECPPITSAICCPTLEGETIPFHRKVAASVRFISILPFCM